MLAIRISTLLFLLVATRAFQVQPASSRRRKLAHELVLKVLKHPASHHHQDPSMQRGVDDSPAQQHQRHEILTTSNVLGNIYRIRMEGETDGFVSAMGVPTFACLDPPAISSPEPSVVDDDEAAATPTARGLEGVLNQGPAFVLDDILSASQCQDLIQTCERLGFGDYKSGKNHHGALQLLVSQETTDALAQKLSRHVDLYQLEERRLESEATATTDTNSDASTISTVDLIYAGLNRRWRVYKYGATGNESFAPHIDAGFPPSGLSSNGMELVWDTNNDPSVSSSQQLVSRLTILFYLNDDFSGGETKFYQPRAEMQSASGVDETPELIASVRPKAGSSLVFPQGVGSEAVEYARQHWPLHEGAPVRPGSKSPKYVIRSDVLFCTERRESLPSSDSDFKLFQHDHKVRETFLPRSGAALNRKFLGLVASTYNPHMGVENLGPLLYSFIRFTKKRQIVEIGAGYTSPWILQALADNDAEMHRIRNLVRSGRARLLDYPWVDSATVEQYWSEPALLTTIDNCQHQKETATGAVAIAKQLGLNRYLDFVFGDAYEIAETFEKESIDVLWCDFGVGSRMKDFAMGAWPSIRDGGFLLVHSTLTNARTREWLEAVRTKKGEEITGLPSDEYVELSFLESHKHFQNSISILQKRKDYTEPLFSEYA